MKKRRQLLIGASLLVAGLGLAALGYVTLQQFSLCCQVSPMPTEAQVRADFPVFAAVSSITSFDLFGMAAAHDPGALLMSALRRFYPCLLLGLILAVTGTSLCLALVLGQKASRFLRWISMAIIVLILFEGAWVCILGPHGGRILSDEEVANNRIHGIGEELAEP